jgi:hypothetical protein
MIAYAKTYVSSRSRLLGTFPDTEAEERRALPQHAKRPGIPQTKKGSKRLKGSGLFI